MTATSDCKSWCDDHQSKYGDDDCYTKSVIYDDGRPEKAPPAPGTMAALFQEGMPMEISWVTVTASQDAEDEEPHLELQFFGAGDDPMESAILHVDLAGLSAFHSSIGAIINKIS